MDESIFDPVLDELFSSLESLEAQTRALATYLQEKGMAPREDFEPYLKRAGEAASVRWRAERVRMNSLLTSALKSAAESVTAQAEKAAREKGEASQEPKGETSSDATKPEAKSRGDETAAQGTKSEQEETKKEEATKNETMKSKAKQETSKDQPNNQAAEPDARQGRAAGEGQEAQPKPANADSTNRQANESSLQEIRGKPLPRTPKLPEKQVVLARFAGNQRAIPQGSPLR